MAEFPFSDLHSFKDYVMYVQTFLPDQFPPREGVGPEDQWSLELAFEGLCFGLNLAVQEKGEHPRLSDCRKLVGEAYELYRAGDLRGGFFKLEEVNELLKWVPSQ
jgi:hypothetical protein